MLSVLCLFLLRIICSTNPLMSEIPRLILGSGLPGPIHSSGRQSSTCTHIRGILFRDYPSIYSLSNHPSIFLVLFVHIYLLDLLIHPHLQKSHSKIIKYKLMEDF